MGDKLGWRVIALTVGVGVAACSGGAATPTGTGGTASGGSGGSGGPGSGGSASGGAGGMGASGPGSAGASSTGLGGAVSGGSGGSGGEGTGGAISGGTGGTTASGTAGSGTGGSGGTGNTAAAGTTGAAGSATGGAAGRTTGTGGMASGGSGVGGTGAGGTAGGPPIIDLFNGTDLTGFNTYKATTTANNAPGMLLAAADAQVIFKPESGMIHVYGDLPDQSTQVHYLLQTAASYGKYNLWWEYKWGTKKFAPYTDLTQYPRDAGVLWHIHGDKTQVWSASIEFQNKWGSTGDIYALYSVCTSLGLPTMKMQFADTAAGGTVVTVNGATGLVQHMRSANYEMPGVGPNASTGVGSDWNSCLLQVDGGAAVYTVNGHIVNEVLSVTDKNGVAVTSGFIAWQAEQAEVYYRNLRIQVLP